MAVKASRGEWVNVPAAGAIREFPESVTGINKRLDDEMFSANKHNKNDGE